MTKPGGIPLSPPAPVYLIHGPEALLRSEAVAAVTEAVLDPGLADFNLDRFEGGSCRAEDVVAAAQTLPVMAARRLVVVRGMECFKGDQLAPLAAYVADPSPTTCLLLEADKVDLRKAPFSTVKRVGHVLACQPLYERQLVPWVHQRVRAMGLSIDPEAAQFLAAYTGPNLSALASELDKAAAWLGPEERRIGLEAVEETVGVGRVHTVFELTDALGERRAGKALKALGTLLDAGEPPLRIQAMIVRHFRNLWKAREAQANGRERDLAAAVGVAPFLAKKLADQARRHSDAELARVFRSFVRVDFDLKGGAASPRRTLESEVLSLCG